MDDFSRKFITEWRNLDLPFQNETFLIAVSGGADSCALAKVVSELKVKKKLDHRFIIVHFDHLLRGEESAEDAIWVAKFAEDLGFEFVIDAAKIGEIDSKSNVEQNARAARYRFLFRTLSRLDAYAMLLGHTKNDQAETLLINLIRGSGLKGLSGMSALSCVEENVPSPQVEKTPKTYRLIRPLLNWAKREDTEYFVKNHKIAFRQDSMNENLDLKRVKVRKELIPMLQNYNPDIIETLSRTARILADENSLLEQYENDRQSKFSLDSRTLGLKQLAKLSNGEVKRLIRRWLSHHRGDMRRLENSHIENIASLIHSKKSGRKVELPGGELVVKQNGELFFRQTKVEK